MTSTRRGYIAYLTEMRRKSANAALLKIPLHGCIQQAAYATPNLRELFH